MIIVSYGGGTNSTAMLIGMRDNNIIPNYILFADPGSEMPHTYKHIEIMNEWCKQNGFPRITRCIYKNKSGKELSLINECMEGKKLPSLAYGWKSCSQKFKIAAQEQFARENKKLSAILKSDEKIIRYIGYDYGEPQRRDNARKFDRVNKNYKNVYPLVDDWKWDRKKCVEVIKKEHLEPPGKSSCYFCPSTKKREIIKLMKNHPDLLQKSLELEKNASQGLVSVKGLGRYFNWGEFVEEYKNQFNLFDIIDQQFDDDDLAEIPCGCYD